MPDENLPETRTENSQKAKAIITIRFDFLNYIKFLAVNLIIVLLPIIGFFTLMSKTKEDLLFVLFTASIATGIVFLQYPVLVLVKYWILKIGVFYLSMCLFFFIYGLVNAWSFSAGGYEAGTWNARLSGGLIMIFFGHMFGFIFFPFVVLINWLLRKQFFVYTEQN